MPAFQFVAILAATFFSGAAIYINLAEHPARMECGTAIAATVFGPSYRRAAEMETALALVSTATGRGGRVTGGGGGLPHRGRFVFCAVPLPLRAIIATK